MNPFLKHFVLVLTVFASVKSHADTVTILGGSKGNANFEASEPATGPIQYSETANWFNASGSETLEFTTDTETLGSSSPGSRACIPFHDRLQVNNTSYTIDSEGEIFSVSFDFGRTGTNWDGDESYRMFLFTADVPVNASIAANDITEIAAVEYQVPTAGVWENQIQFNAFFASDSDDIGRTIFVGMVLTNLSGEDVFPRLDEINLNVDSNVLFGDLNADGQVDLLDVAPFVSAFGGAYQVEADINLDGVVDLLDIAPFVDLLTAP